VNVGSTPERILPAHPADQIADLPSDGRPTRLAAPNLPGPVEPKAFAVPSDDRRGLDDG
jgi:hypothetical protein